MTEPNQSAGANRRPPGQSDGLRQFRGRGIAADPARCGTAVAEFDR